MKVNSQLKDKTLYLSLSGELDHHGAGQAMTAIESRIDVNMPRDCVLDMGGVTFMDSSGIAVIIKTLRRTAEIGGKLKVTNVAPQPMKVIDAAGICRLVDISAAE